MGVVVDTLNEYFGRKHCEGFFMADILDLIDQIDELATFLEGYGVEWISGYKGHKKVSGGGWNFKGIAMETIFTITVWNDNIPAVSFECVFGHENGVLQIMENLGINHEEHFCSKDPQDMQSFDETFKWMKNVMHILTSINGVEIL